MNIWGEKFKISIFGESHGGGIGVVIDGIPGGTTLDLDKIEEYMRRRKPGQNEYSTPRKEDDKVKILSGFYNGKTTGTPLCAVIMNEDTKSSSYEPNLLRPGHADYTALMKYGESRDFRGSGHFSGRITAPIVFAGAIAMQLLQKNGITIGAHIKNIGKVYDKAFDLCDINADELNTIKNKAFPVCDDIKGEEMKNYIEIAKSNKNSLGGMIECAVCGIKAGIGSPFFASVESKISSMMFSIPAVKGIEFGAGFKFSEMDGKEANDEFYIDCGEIKTYTNNNAGINGGITNGMPIVFRLAIKPTPSISAKQRTVDIEKGENCEIETKGRHDPCIVPRAVPVIETATAIAVLDMLLSDK